MNLPFSPIFFKKMDIYQHLMEYERMKDDKRLWAGEKALLLWAGSEHHQHIGSAIGLKHVKDALDICVGKGYLTEEERNRLKGSVRHILESLVTHEFGDVYDEINPKDPTVKVNIRGVLAGRVLIETNNLRGDSYYVWLTRTWWVVLVGGLLILLGQVFEVVGTVFRSMFCLVFKGM